MADAIAVSVANAVVSYLAAAGTTTSIDPERSYADWELALEDAETLHVDVALVTSELGIGLSARGMERFVVPVDVAIRKRFGTDKQDDDTGRIDLANIDELMLLTQEVFEAFLPHRLTTFTDAVWESTKVLVAADRDMLRTARQFTSVIRVTFVVNKAIA